MRRRANYRSRIEIFASILDTVANKGDMGTTKMAYHSRLSYNQICKHIVPLLEGQLLDQHDRFYSITEKGRKFLGLYVDMAEMIKSMQ